MNITDRMQQHNAWATRVLLERCRALTQEQFEQRFDIGPGSLHDTLLHIIGAMLRWSDRLASRAVRPSIEKDKSLRTADQLLDQLGRAECELEAVVCKVGREHRHDEMMQAEFSLVQFTRGSAIVHVLTHGMHHRAQALNMLRRLGVTDLPEIDPLDWELATAPQRA
jgi:uncharacterized damage-inducible protein DinB